MSGAQFSLSLLTDLKVRVTHAMPQIVLAGTSAKAPDDVTIQVKLKSCVPEGRAVVEGRQILWVSFNVPHAINEQPANSARQILQNWNC